MVALLGSLGIKNVNACSPSADCLTPLDPPDLLPYSITVELNDVPSTSIKLRGSSGS